MESTSDPASATKWFHCVTNRRRFICEFAVALGTGPTVMIPAASGQSSTSQQTGKRVRITLGHHHPPGDQIDVYAHDFADLVAKKTNGQAAVEIIPAAQLGAEQEAVKGIQLGTLQMTVASDPFLSDYVKEIGTEQLPFLFDTWDQAVHSLEGPLADEITKRLLNGSNVRCLSWLVLGWRHMLFRRPSPTIISGMAGLKMRAPQIDFYVRMFELLGAKPVTITLSEVYTALQSGVVDGVEQPLQAAIDSKFTEVCRYVLLTQHMFASITHMVNKKFFAALPKNVQDAIVESAKEAVKVNNIRAKEAEDAVVNKIKSMGITVDTPRDRPAWKSAVQPLISDWVKARPGAASLINMIKTTK